MATVDVPNRTAFPQSGQVLPAFAHIGWRWISRNPASAIAPILVPFVFLYFLRLIAPVRYFPLEVVGAMLFTTQNIGNWVLGDSAGWRLEMRMQDIFVASPLTKIRYLLGVAFSNLIPAVPALVVLGILLDVVQPGIPWWGWFVLVGCIGVVWILFSAIGIAMSSLVQSQREIWPVGELTFTVLGMLSPLYFRLSLLPPIWQSAARFLPATYAALLARGALGIDTASSGELGIDAAFLVGSAILGTVIALRLYRWQER